MVNCKSILRIYFLYVSYDKSFELNLFLPQGSQYETTNSHLLKTIQQDPNV